VGTLATADQVSMCEALLRLAVHHGSVGAAEDWDVLKQARSMLDDVESLEGREQESALLRAWARDPEDPEGAAFFEKQVLRHINTLASFAPEILEETLGAKSLVKK
jgi:SET and MYND domain-containing protein